MARRTADTARSAPNCKHAACSNGNSERNSRRALNHITALRDPESKHYNLYEFQTEKRQALGKWATEIEALTEPASVISHNKG